MDATFHCLHLFWPVVNPLGRYRLARQLSSLQGAPDWAVRHVPLHDTYWGTEANMAEGSPLMALQRSENVRTVPALWVQPRVDEQHIYQDPGSTEPGTDLDKFLAAYRSAGGDIDLAYYDAPQYFTVHDPRSAPSQEAFERMIAFFKEHIPEP